MNKIVQAAVLTFVLGMVTAGGSVWTLHEDQKHYDAMLAGHEGAMRLFGSDSASARNPPIPVDPVSYYWIAGTGGALVLCSFMVLGVGIATGNERRPQQRQDE